jgi:hypothetical protein
MLGNTIIGIGLFLVVQAVNKATEDAIIKYSGFNFFSKAKYFEFMFYHHHK